MVLPAQQIVQILNHRWKFTALQGLYIMKLLQNVLCDLLINKLRYWAIYEPATISRSSENINSLPINNHCVTFPISIPIVAYWVFCEPMPYLNSMLLKNNIFRRLSLSTLAVFGKAFSFEGSCFRTAQVPVWYWDLRIMVTFLIDVEVITGSVILVLSIILC